MRIFSLFRHMLYGESCMHTQVVDGQMCGQTEPTTCCVALNYDSNVDRLNHLRAVWPWTTTAMWTDWTTYVLCGFELRQQCGQTEPPTCCVALNYDSNVERLNHLRAVWRWTTTAMWTDWTTYVLCGFELRQQCGQIEPPTCCVALNYDSNVDRLNHLRAVWLWTTTAIWID
jgi:hypothetical protein